MKKVPEITLDEILKHEPPLTDVSRDTLTRRCQNGTIKARKVGIQWVVKLTKPNLKAIAERERAPKTSRTDKNS
jgi:hypothetical protein